MIIIPDVQIPYDPNLRRWSGRYFVPIVNKLYTVPTNAANHPEARGRSGICTEVRSSDFGMVWAVIKFMDHKEPDGTYDYPPTGVIRTKYLIPYQEGE